MIFPVEITVFSTIKWHDYFLVPKPIYFPVYAKSYPVNRILTDFKNKDAVDSALSCAEYFGRNFIFNVEFRKCKS